MLNISSGCFSNVDKKINAQNKMNLNFLNPLFDVNYTFSASISKKKNAQREFNQGCVMSLLITDC